MAPSRLRGELEADIMSILWAAESPLTAKEIQSRFTANTPAITTLITVLDRMRLKGNVHRDATAGRSHVFTAAQSQLETVAATMETALSSSGDRVAALLHFAGSLTEEDREFLRQAISE